jgi:hypothetical protein
MHHSFAVTPALDVKKDSALDKTDYICFLSLTYDFYLMYDTNIVFFPKQ